MGGSTGWLVLLRHGQSAWNEANQFTGWMDVDLTAAGEAEAWRAGKYLREAGFTFDLGCTSLLKRAIRSLWIALEALDQAWLPVDKNWRLNERHYGALQGRNKAEMVDRYGPEQVYRWRRSYSERPPMLEYSDPRHPRFDPRYAGVEPALLPVGESLEDTLARVLPYWTGVVAPALRQGRRVLLVAHGNSIRVLVSYLEQLSPAQVADLAVPTGIPVLYELDEDLSVVKRSELGDPAVVRAAHQHAQKAAQVRGSGEDIS